MNRTDVEANDATVINNHHHVHLDVAKVAEHYARPAKLMPAIVASWSSLWLIGWLVNCVLWQVLQRVDASSVASVSESLDHALWIAGHLAMTTAFAVFANVFVRPSHYWRPTGAAGLAILIDFGTSVAGKLLEASGALPHIDYTTTPCLALMACSAAVAFGLAAMDEV